MSDLVERLRANAVLTEHDHDKDILREAAARIEQLEAALKRLRHNASPMMRGWIDAALEERT